MIIDVSFFEPFYQAEKQTSYSDLLNYIRQLDFSEDFFKKMGFYYLPFFDKKTLYVPLSIYFLLFYFKGVEQNDHSDLKRAYYIMEVSGKSIKKYFSDKLQNIISIIGNFKISYEDRYGKERADLIRKKISESMKKIDKKTIEKRNRSISNYAKNRPESHNRNISIGRTGVRYGISRGL